MNNHQAVIKQIQESPDFRKALTGESFSWFFATYFTHYITCPTAPFQKAMFDLLQNDELLKIAITAFRGSAKSTIATLAYPIWAMVGKPEKKYTLLVSQTQELSKQILTNIKQELSSNELLMRDFGPFTEVADEWRVNSFVIPQYGARISAISQSESIRGLRHRQHRPDLIVIDDVEDLESVKTKENRDKLWNWFTGEVMPIGDISTKIVVVGNLLHEDSLMMRLKEAVELNKMDGVYREYPLINTKGEITWPGKYPTMKHIEIKRRQVADDSAWYREYLLKFISDDSRIVQRTWPQFWTKLPDLNRVRPWLVGLGADMAISEKTSSDFTGLIPFLVCGFGDDLKIYILSYIVNKRLNFTDGIDEIKKLCGYLETDYHLMPTVFVEKANIETAASQVLKINKVLADSVNTSGMDKQARLGVTTQYIRMGKVLFPQKGSEQLISQIVNFGIEKHDDLVDAFTLIILKIMESDRPTYKSTEPPKPPEDTWGIDPFTGEYRDLAAPITAGMLDMKF
jgi:phage terminase large subunit-like protein